MESVEIYEEMDGKELEHYLERLMLEIDDALHAFAAAEFLENTRETLGDEIFDQLILGYSSTYRDVAECRLDKAVDEHDEALNVAKEREDIDASEYEINWDELVNRAYQTIENLQHDRIGVSGIADPRI